MKTLELENTISEIKYLVNSTLEKIKERIDDLRDGSVKITKKI